ncbi:MAG: hypothetical protein LBU73_07255 [Helicobacteraceae bacterium]|jgi:hypothetical protein|nr:hypothetical protein [Helicobacteraceae bacterium]
MVRFIAILSLETRSAISFKLIALFLLAIAPIFADDLDFFDEPPKTGAVANERAKDNVLSGAISLQSAYQFREYANRGNFRQQRARLDLDLRESLWEGANFQANGYGFWEGAPAPAAKSSANLNEAFIQARLSPNFDLKVGRQLIVWGKSDMLRVTDCLNPLDNREPAMTDIADLRLGAAAARADFYAGNWDLQGALIAERRFGERPNFPSEFAPFDADFRGEKPRGAQGAIAAFGAFEGYDVSLNYASVFRDEIADRSRVNLYGAAGAIAAGNFLLKGEAAALRSAENSRIFAQDFARNDLLAGVEYNGASDLTIAVEGVTRREIRPASSHTETYAARIAYDLFNARLKFVSLSSLTRDLSRANGWFSRFQGDYEIKNNLFFTLGFVFYGGDLPPFSLYDHNDRVFAKLKANF